MSYDAFFAYRADGIPPDVLEECKFVSRAALVKEEAASDGSTT